MKFLIVLNIEGGDSNGYLYFLSSEVVKHEHRLIILYQLRCMMLLPGTSIYYFNDLRNLTVR